MQNVGIFRWHQHVGSACIDDGALPLEARRFFVDTSIIRGDFPVLLVGGLCVSNLARKSGRIETAKRDLPVLGSIGVSLQVNANNVTGQIPLLIQHLHDGRGTQLIRARSPKA